MLGGQPFLRFCTDCFEYSFPAGFDGGIDFAGAGLKHAATRRYLSILNDPRACLGKLFSQLGSDVFSIYRIQPQDKVGMV